MRLFIKHGQCIKYNSRLFLHESRRCVWLPYQQVGPSVFSSNQEFCRTRQVRLRGTKRQSRVAPVARQTNWHNGMTHRRTRTRIDGARAAKTNIEGLASTGLAFSLHPSPPAAGPLNSKRSTHTLLTAGSSARPAVRDDGWRWETGWWMAGGWYLIPWRAFQLTAR